MEGSDGAIEVARDLFSKQPGKYYYTDQYSNDANWQAHYFGTAEEIWKQTSGKVTHFISGVGTGGTVMGTGKRLKELNREIKVIAIEPDEPFHGIEGLKHIQSSIKPKIFSEKFPDETILRKDRICAKRGPETREGGRDIRGNFVRGGLLCCKKIRIGGQPDRRYIRGSGQQVSFRKVPR